MSDYYRHAANHFVEVAQVAAHIAGALGLNARADGGAVGAGT